MKRKLKCNLIFLFEVSLIILIHVGFITSISSSSSSTSIFSTNTISSLNNKNKKDNLKIIKTLSTNEIRKLKNKNNNKTIEILPDEKIYLKPDANNSIVNSNSIIGNIPIYNNLIPFNTLSLTDNNKDKIVQYQGSVIFNVPNLNSTDRINLKVVNNFIISNSNISQYIIGNDNNPNQNTKENNNTNSIITDDNKEREYQDKILKLDDYYKANFSKIKSELEDKINIFKNENIKDVLKIKEYEDIIRKLNLNIKNDEDKYKEYENKIKQLIVSNNELQIFKLKENETKIVLDKNIIQDNKIKPDTQNNIYYLNTIRNNKLTHSAQNDCVGCATSTVKIKDQQIKDNNSPLAVVLLPKVNNPEPSNSDTVKSNIGLIPTKSNPVLHEALACTDPYSVDFHHFLMNYEKCKNLNNLYQQILNQISTITKDIETINCSYDCKFEILIKFTTEVTELSLMQNKENTLSLIKTIIISPPVYEVSLLDTKLLQMEKNNMKDFLVIYLYSPLTKLLGILPNYSQYNLLVVAQGYYFESMSDIDKPIFLRSLLYLASIDDRFTLNWNNIRIINKNEKKMNDYLAVKDSAVVGIGNESGNGIGRNSKILSLNFNENGNGVNLVGSEDLENYNNKNGNNYYKSNIDSALNPSEDPSKTSIQISSAGDYKENVYSKNIDVIGMNNLDGSLINSLMSNGKNNVKRGIYNNKNNINNIEYESTVNFMEVRKEGNQANSIGVTDELDKIFNDPTILKLKNYLHDNSIIDDYLHQNEEDNTNLNPGLYISDYNMRFKQKDNKLRNKNLTKKNNTQFTQIALIPKLKQTLENNTKFNNNPCFNKGYYDYQLNVTGIGNYEMCYKYIEDNFKDYLNKTNIKNSLKLVTVNNDTNKIFLGKEYIKIKFMFYEKENNLNSSFKYHEEMSYSNLKNKIKNICSLQYSLLLSEKIYSKIGINTNTNTKTNTNTNSNNLSKLCFDLTYFTILFDKRGVSGNSTLVIKTHLSSVNVKESSVFFFISEKTNLNIIYFFMSSTLISFLLFLGNFKITNWLSNLLALTLNKRKDKSILSNDEIEEILSYFKVRSYLFYDDNSYFKLKYGKDFDYCSIDKNILYPQIKELYYEKEDLKKLIFESRKYLLEIKIAISIHIILILFIICSIITFCILLQNVQLELGTVKMITTMLSVLFIVLIILICFKISSIYENKCMKESQEENKYKK